MDPEREWRDFYTWLYDQRGRGDDVGALGVLMPRDGGWPWETEKHPMDAAREFITDLLVGKYKDEALRDLHTAYFEWSTREWMPGVGDMFDQEDAETRTREHGKR